MKINTAEEKQKKQMSCFQNIIKKIFIMIILFSFWNCSLESDSEIKKSDTKKISSFSFLSPKAVGSINGNKIKIEVPDNTDITNLVAYYEFYGAKVLVDEILQNSGVSINDFSNKVNYTVIAEDGSSILYDVEVKFQTSLSGFSYTKRFHSFNQNKEIDKIIPIINSQHILKFSSSPDLPKGITLDPDSGIITGTPIEYFSNKQSFVISARSQLETVNTTITIFDIKPVPPQISVSHNMINLKLNESSAIQIYNSGGPIEEIKISDEPSWIELDKEKLIMNLKPTKYNRPSFGKMPYNDKAGFFVEISNSGGKSRTYVSCTLNIDPKVQCQKPYLNIEKIFDDMHQLDGKEIIDETLYMVTNMEYEVSTPVWLYDAYKYFFFNNGSARREVTRSDWLNNFPYTFRQTEDKVFVRRKNSLYEAEYYIDVYKSKNKYQGATQTEILYIVKSDESKNFPAFFQFYHLNNKIESMRIHDKFYISIPEPDNFEIKKSYGRYNLYESRPVVVTKGIQRLSMNVEQDLYPICGITPASISEYNINSVFEYLESNRGSEEFYNYHIQPYLD